ncbi:P-loop NTPase family protein [Allosalinactinospora lopnorensis]|uniref:hypothetical protein n=1 Tax=Allosalinactinospora lopnorensis TaxID=1352348 RepID=UPI000623DF82|nr:hypothetical protein [Allosalinactinospora lopnorensis]
MTRSRPEGRGRAHGNPGFLLWTVIVGALVLLLAFAIWLQGVLEGVSRAAVWAGFLAALGAALAKVIPEVLPDVVRRLPKPRKPAPRQRVFRLRPSAGHFVGYTEERARMHRLLADFPHTGWRRAIHPPSWVSDRRTSGAPQVIVITGAPAVGKSELANRVARDAEDRFPDGVYEMDLCGDRADQKRRSLGWRVLDLVFLTATGRRVEPEGPDLVGGPRLGSIAPRTVPDLLRELLDQFGDASLVTPGQEWRLEQVWHNLTHDRRLLLVLENAEDPEQVRRLLPSTGMSAVIVTSRRAFTEARFRFHGVHLEGLSDEDGMKLLGEIAPVAGPPERRRHEDGLRRKIVGHCYRLPLMLRQCAQRLAGPSGTQELLDKLRNLETPLVHGDGFRTHLTVHLQYCGAEERLLLRRMVQTGMDEVTDYAAAALLDTTRSRARRTIEKLAEVFLLRPLGQDADGLLRHELLQPLGEALLELGPEDFGLPEAEAEKWVVDEAPKALERLLATHTWMVEQALRRLHGPEIESERDTVPPGLVAGLEPMVPEQPRVWLAREHDMLLGCCYIALEEGHYPLGLRLARAYSAMCQSVRSHWLAWEKAVEVQAHLAEADRNPHALARAMLDNAELCASRGNYDLGAKYARWARYVFERRGAAPRWHARARRALGVNLHGQGHLDTALRELHYAGKVFTEHGERWWWARTQIAAAEIRIHIGPQETAERLLREVWRTFAAAGDVENRDLTRVLLAEALDAGGYQLQAWLMLREMYARFDEDGRLWHKARCLRVMGALDDTELDRQYEHCDLVFNKDRRFELRNRAESHFAREARSKGAPSEEPVRHAVRAEYRRRLREDAERLLGEYAAHPEKEFNRARSSRWRRGAAATGDWSRWARIALLERAIGMFEEMGDMRSVHQTRLTLGRVLLKVRRIDEAALVFASAVEGFEKLGSRWRRARTQRIMAAELFEALMARNLARGILTVPSGAREQMTEVRQHAEEAFTTYRELENHVGRVRAQTLLARILWASKADEGEVERHLNEAESVAEWHGEVGLAEEARRWSRSFFVEHPGDVARLWPIANDEEVWRDLHNNAGPE